MDVHIRLGIILIAALVILFLLIDAWFRERRKHRLKTVADTVVDDVEEVEITPQLIHSNQVLIEKETFQPDLPEDLIIINVIAKDSGHFASYDLLQAISSAGLHYGPMNIFHYYKETPMGKISLFNLASATEPGDFDLDHIGNFSCAGLTLFMNLRRVPDAIEALDTMVSAAEQLAEDLDGELFTKHHTPWNMDTMLQYQNKALTYQTPL